MSFDIVQAISALAAFLGGTAGVYLITEGVKRIPQIPINEGQKNRLRSLAGVLSAVAVIAEGYSVNQSLRPDDVQGVLLALLALAATWFGAHQTHQVVTGRSKK